MKFLCCLNVNKKEYNQEGNGSLQIQKGVNDRYKQTNLMQPDAEKTKASTNWFTESLEKALKKSNRKKKLENARQLVQGHIQIQVQEEQIPSKVFSYFQIENLASKNKRYLLYNFLTKGCTLSNVQRLQYSYIRNWERDRQDEKSSIQKFKNEFLNQFNRQTQNSKDYTASMRERDTSFLNYLFEDHLVSQDLFTTLKNFEQQISTLVQFVGPVSFAFNAIKRLYRVNKKLNRFYIILELQGSDKKSLKKRIKQRSINYFNFNSFVKGYSDYERAHSQFMKRTKKYPMASLSNVIFVEVFHQFKDQAQTEYDFGYYYDPSKKEGENLIVNIKNVFLFKEFRQDRQIMQIKYGELPRINKLRKDYIQRGKLSTIEKNMRRNISFLQYESSRKMSLSAIFREFQDYFLAKLTAKYEIQNAINNNQPKQKIHQLKVYYAGIHLSQKKDNSETEFRQILSQVQAKEQNQQKGSNLWKTIGKIRLASFYYIQSRGQCEKSRQYKERFIAEVSRISNAEIENLWYDNKLKDEGMQAKAYQAIAMIESQKFNRNQLKDAVKKMHSIRAALSEKYNLDYQAIPLNHLVMMYIGKVNQKIGSVIQAQNLLANLTEWMKSCELSQSLFQVLEIRLGCLQAMKQFKKNQELTKQKGKLRAIYDKMI